MKISKGKKNISFELHNEESMKLKKVVMGSRQTKYETKKKESIVSKNNKPERKSIICRQSY